MTVLETTAAYYKPGVYVGQLIKPRTSASTTFRRIPCYIGKGSPSLLYSNKAVVRGYISDETLTFTKVAPFRAYLNYKALGAKDTAKLVLGDGSEVDTRLWKYVQDEKGRYIAIEVTAAAYKEASTYILSYQSADPTALDDTEIDDIERVLEIGLRMEGNDFQSTDYELETIIGKFEEGSDVIGVKNNTGTGDLPQVHPDSVYQGPTRKFHFAVEDVKVLDLPQVIAVTPAGSNTGNGLPSFNVEGWTGTADTTYTLLVQSISSDGNLVTFEWTRDNPSGNGTVQVRLGFESNAAFIDGIRVDWGDLTRYKANDLFTYDLGLRSSPQMLMSWFSDDVSGGNGELTVNSLNRSKVTWTEGMSLVFGSNIAAYKAGDAYTLQVTSTGRIIWKYDLEGVQTVPVGDLSFDQTGVITGTRRAYYLTLAETNTQDVTKVELLAANGAATALADSDYVHIEGTGYVVFKAYPENAASIRVSYTFTNAPGFGQVYYIDAEAKKPKDAYNKVLFLTKDDYRTFAGYPTPDNHLGIMAEMAFEIVGLDQVAVVQVYDSDRDGKYSNADYNNAVLATQDTAKISDICVLSCVGSIGAVVTELNRRNDPFQMAETLGWFGYPANTPVGTSQMAEGTLTYYGGQVLQVGANSNAHGSHISVLNTWGKRTITQYNGQQVQVTLDGSFVAGMMAAMTAGFTNAWDTLLSKPVGGFDSIHELSDGEIKIAGTYGWIILEGSDVITVLDATTHDKYAPDTFQINAMTQKHYMNHVVREQMKRALIGLVPESREDGEQLVKSALASILADAVTKGFIASYQDNNGVSRPIDANSDIKVQRSETDPTKFYFTFAYFLRYHIARCNGLYLVDTNELAW